MQTHNREAFLIVIKQEFVRFSSFVKLVEFPLGQMVHVVVVVVVCWGGGCDGKRESSGEVGETSSLGRGGRTSRGGGRHRGQGARVGAVSYVRRGSGEHWQFSAMFHQFSVQHLYLPTCSCKIVKKNQMTLDGRLDMYICGHEEMVFYVVPEYTSKTFTILRYS